MQKFRVSWPIHAEDGIYDIEADTPQKAVEMAEDMMGEGGHVVCNISDSVPGAGFWVQDESGDIVLDTTDDRLAQLGSWALTMLTENVTGPWHVPILELREHAKELGLI